MRQMARFCIVAAVLAFIVSCSSYESRGDSAYSRAQKLQGYQKSLQQKTAYVMYQKAVEARPDKIGARLRARFLDMSLVRVKMVLDEGNIQSDAIPLLMSDIERHITPATSPEFKNGYAKFLVQMADSLASKNRLEEALSSIDKAISYVTDPSPLMQRKKDLISGVVNENFDLAESEYANGKANKDNEALVRAEYYTHVTLLFDPTHAEALKLLSELRKENIGSYSGYLKVIETIPDTTIFRKVNKYDILLAIPVITRGASITMSVNIYNYSYDPLRLKTGNFFIVDSEGKRYQAKEGKLDPEILEQEHEAKFKLVFPKPSGEIVKLLYENGPHVTEKFFN